MRHAFIDTPDDIQWLKDAHLAGCPLPSRFADFKFAVLQGNEDAPYAANLYESEEPNFDDDYYRVRFAPSDGIAFNAVLYNGKTDKPYTGA